MPPLGPSMASREKRALWGVSPPALTVPALGGLAGTGPLSVPNFTDPLSFRKEPVLIHSFIHSFISQIFTERLLCAKSHLGPQGHPSLQISHSLESFPA